MRLGSYFFDERVVVDEIKKQGYKSVLLQLPDGIKRYASLVVDKVETETDARVMVSLDPCYGACDVPLCAAKTLGVDLVVQLGHLPIPNLRFPLPVLFVNVSSDGREEEAVKKAVKSLDGKRVGLVTTAQHIHKIPVMTRVLRENGFEPMVGKGDGRIAEDGQVLGCNVITANSVSDMVDCFLFVGTGRFHPLAVAFATDKPVVAVNPFTLEVLKDEFQVEKNRLVRRRYGFITLAEDAEVFGVIVSVKPGQMRLRKALEVEEKLRKHGKRVYRLVADSVEPSVLKGFSDVQCLVSTACPRIAFDDALRFDVPLLTPFEVEVLVGEKSIEDYRFDIIP